LTVVGQPRDRDAAPHRSRRSRTALWWWPSLLIVACALVLAGSSAVAGTRGVPSDRSAHAASSAAPTVTLTAPTSPIRSVVTLQAYATPPAGATITQVQFYISPAGQDQWQLFDTETTPVNGVEYDATLDTTDTAFVPQNGPYDLYAVATDSNGDQAASAPAQGVTVANSATYIGLSDPGSPISGSVTLTASPEAGGFTPDTVTFEDCPASNPCLSKPGEWHTIATVPQDANDNNYTASFDTTKLNDGTYDLTVTGEDGSGDAYIGEVTADVVVDNTPPTVTLASPGGSLTGVVTLTAAASDAGSGVAAVRFESAPAGSGTWSTIATATSPPFTVNLDTRQLANGSYDLRAVATDVAGNTATSPAVAGVVVSNPTGPPPGDFTITDYAAPATSISLLGEIAGSSQRETWAYGYTNAPAPTIDGATLPYTAAGDDQLVLLRYTDATGWEIADVLRNADGSAYPLDPGGTIEVIGQMTGSGEAWLVVAQTPAYGGAGTRKIAVFHRLPGGQFLLDPVATELLAPLLTTDLSGDRLRLGQEADGTVFGLLVAPSQPTQTAIVSSPSGPVQLTTQLQYGVLTGDTWTVQSAPVPAADLPSQPAGVTVTLEAADQTAPGSGWGLVELQGQFGGTLNSVPLILGQFGPGGWQFVRTGLDALDLTGEFAPGSQDSQAAGSLITVAPVAVQASPGGVWLSAQVRDVKSAGTVIAYFDDHSGTVTNSWCTGLPRPSADCAQPLDLDHAAAIPDASFATSGDTIADALSTTSDTVDVYQNGIWNAVAAPGFENNLGRPNQSLFVDPDDGWLVGANSLGLVAPTPPQSQLAPWPEANRNPLLSVALPPGQSTTDTTGALAVGLNGTALHYDPTAGWQVDATPPQVRHIGLYSVAFDGPSTAFAVGVEGTILRWSGTAWSADPQSTSLTIATLNSVAFAPDGEGWAVGARGTILHWDGSDWSIDQVDADDATADISSVAVAGQNVYAIAAGNLIERGSDGVWERVDPSLLPSPAPAAGALQLLSGLPDGGLAIAGKSLLILRQSASSSFQYAPQSFQGIPVALAAFRDGDGDLRAFVSVAPPISTLGGDTDATGGFPAGDGDLLLETDSGWDDLSHDEYPQETYAALGDGVVQPDPVLAVAASADGTHAWAVGGYSGAHAADGIGTDTPLAARSAGWLTSAIWRYDAGGSVQSVATAANQVTIPAAADTVSFAYFSSPLCKEQCDAVQDAQPDVNLESAAAQIASFAQQPGGPSFAVLGGNARGPMDETSYRDGLGALDLSRLPDLLAPLGSVPLYAAYGPLDAVPTSTVAAQPWADAFSDAPAPFGPGPAPAGVTPVSSGDPTGSVDKYYAFDVSQNGGTLMAIVLDNSAGALDASAPGQSAWLTATLAQAQATSTPAVVFAAVPLNDNDLGAADDSDAVAAQLAAAGVLAVFTTSGGANSDWETQTDQVAEIPTNPAPGTAQIPEYEGATLTYQQSQNNGVLWYDVSVDTSTGQLTVDGIPVVSSLALEPLDGLTAARSSTLSFQAIGRRPAGTIATTPADSKFPGFNSYVSIPAASCSSCIAPSYSFTSSQPTVGNFVAPSAAGSTYPKLTAAGKTTASSSSGLFCAYNPGTTVVTVTSGLLSSSLTVTVQPGNIGQPCGTVTPATPLDVVTVPGRLVYQTSGAGTGAAPVNPPPARVVVKTPTPIPPPPAPVVAPVTPAPIVRHPAPPPPPVVAQIFPAPQPVPSFVLEAAAISVTPVVPPPVPPAATPVPPGGGATAQATARREEKARKEARQSAYVVRPAGAPATDWFFPAVGVTSVLALLLIAGGLRPGPRPNYAFVEAREQAGRPRPRQGRRR
jgi:hypothetical protein